MSYTDEQNIIGSIILRNECLEEIGFLTPEMFTVAEYGQMFFICKRLIESGNAVDASSLIDRVVNDQYPTEFATRDVGDCIRNTGTSLNVKRYARAVRKEYCARIFYEASMRVTGDPDTLAVELEDVKKAIEIADGIEGSDASKPLSQIAKENKDNYFKENVKPKIMLGLSRLDDLLGGLEGGDLIIIGARPAVGKSAFASQITSHFAEMGKKVGFYNLEMQEKQVYERFVAARSGIELTRIRRAINYQNDEKQKFDEANEYLMKQNNIIVSTGAKRISEIRADAKKQAFDVIIIDYMQLVKPDRTYGVNRYAEVGAISHAVKELAMEMNIPIIGLCQLNRVSEAREDHEPSMGELRESGDFEQDASVIMLLWNTNKEDRSQKCIKVDKSRQGKTGKIDLVFDGNRMKFTEADEHGFMDVIDDVVFD